MKRNSIEHFCVEGDCEKRFIKDLKLIGRVNIFDFSEKSLDQLKRMITTFPKEKKTLWINIVFDTDVLKNPTVLQKFIQNVSFLVSKKYNVRLFQQHENFEQELCSSLGLTEIQLFNLFDTKNASEFKKKFLSHQNSLCKLKSCSGNIDFWCSPLIPNLAQFTHISCTYNDVKP